MSTWPWQKWVGKLLLLAVSILQAIMAAFEITTWGWAPTVITFVTWVAQFVIGLIPPAEPAPPSA